MLARMMPCACIGAEHTITNMLLSDCWSRVTLIQSLLMPDLTSLQIT